MRDAGIVAGERFLARHVEHLLHHVHLVADAVDVGDDQAEARPERARIAAEALDRVGVALRHGAHAERDRDDDQDDERDDEDVESERDWNCGPAPPPGTAKPLKVRAKLRETGESGQLEAVIGAADAAL